MWRTKAPAKVLNLLWRAAANCLPVLTLLQQKKVPVISICLMCHGEEETILHALVTCPRAVQIWSTFLSTSDIYQETREDFFSWVQGIFESISHDMRAKVATVC